MNPVREANPWYREPPEELTPRAQAAWGEHMEANRRLREAIAWYNRWSPSWWDRFSGRVALAQEEVHALFLAERAARKRYENVRLEEISARLDRLSEGMEETRQLSVRVQERVRALQQIEAGRNQQPNESDRGPAPAS